MDRKTLKTRIIFRRVIQGLVVLVIFLMAVTVVNHENDVFWQLRMGEEIISHRHFPTTDTWSLPAYGAVWTLHEWLPSVAFYLLYSHFGAPGLVFFKAAIVAVTFGLFLRLFNRFKVNLYISILVLGLAALVNTRGIWMVFPSLFEYLFIAITLVLLEYYRDSKRQFVVICLALLALIWANSHGSFLALTVIVGAYLFGDIGSSFLRKRWRWYTPIGEALTNKQRWSLLAVMLVSLVAPLMTPNGVWTWLYPFRISLGGFTSYVSEYQKFWQVWHWDWEDFVYGFSVILSGGLIGLFMVSYKKLHLTDLGLGVFFMAIAILAVRHVAILALISLYLIAKYVAVWFGEYRGIFARSLVKDVLVIFFLVAFIYFYKTRVAPFGWGLSEENYPAHLAEIVNASSVPGNMFNHYNYGGYLIWKMPKYQVFVDGRLEMYMGKPGEEYLTILEVKPGYEQLLEKYQINFMINYWQDPVTEAILSEKFKDKWRYIASDGQYVLLVKNTSENQNLIAAYWTKEKEDEFKKKYRVMMAEFRAKILNDTGIDKVKERKYVEALADFQRAERYDPDWVEVRLNLAGTYLLLGTTNMAEGEYEEVLRLEPSNATAKKGLAEIQKIKEANVQEAAF